MSDSEHFFAAIWAVPWILRRGRDSTILPIAALWLAIGHAFVAD